MKIGAFGEVRMCVHRDTGAQRAVKVLRKSNMDDDEKKMLFNEINILREVVSIKSHFITLATYLMETARISLPIKLYLIRIRLLGSSQYCEDVRVLRGREALLHRY